MDQHSNALNLLGLGQSASQAEIEQAYQQKQQQLQASAAKAPTEALKQKFAQALAELDQAKALLSSAAKPTPESKPAAPLSATKLADLPGAGPEAGDINIEIGLLLAGRYQVKEQIGAGGMGAVYHAYDQSKQEDIAIKVLLPALAKSERAKSRFMDEARISAKLSHPGIVNVFDVQQDGELLFLTMELLEGQDLRRLMEARKLSQQDFDQAEALQLAQALAAALSYAHQHTVHRDLKPENIWVDEDGQYKIMDFGIARVQSTSQRTQTGAAMGTAYYMAPEQLKGTGQIDGRADQYAVGVLLYELLSGDIPAGRTKPLRELRKDLSKGFALAVDKSLEPKAEERHSDIQSFADALNSKGSGFSLPLKPIGIAAGIVIAVLAVGGLLKNTDLGDLKNLLPKSQAEISQQKAQAARLQGEIKTLKNRLEQRRRSLGADVREASREGGGEALELAQRLTEQSIFAGSQLINLEGQLSMAETQVREGTFTEAQNNLTEVRDGYQYLLKEFDTAHALHNAEEDAAASQAQWQQQQRQYNLSTPASLNKAEAAVQQAQTQQRSGELQAALNSYHNAESLYRDVQQEISPRINDAKAQIAEQKATRGGQEVLVEKMVTIPSGSFRMGCVYGQDCGDYEKPVHRVSIKAFKLSEAEVTFAQWDVCVAAGACSHRPGDEGWGRGNLPVINVSYNDITEDFIPWLNRETDGAYRLPSESEWEYAARAGSESKYSWGNSFGENRANCDGCGNSKPFPIRSFGHNAFGLYDMHSNVREWIQDCWNGSYQGAPSNGKAWTGGDCGRRVLRGGTWRHQPHYLRSASRHRGPVSKRRFNIGFRLAQDI